MAGNEHDEDRALSPEDPTEKSLRHLVNPGSKSESCHNDLDTRRSTWTPFATGFSIHGRLACVDEMALCALCALCIEMLESADDALLMLAAGST